MTFNRDDMTCIKNVCMLKFIISDVISGIIGKKDMNKQERWELSINIIQEYYRNNTQPFIEYVDEDVLWYGPATGQFLSGKQSILDAWANESHSLTFSLGNMRLDYTSSHDSYCEVLVSFPVTTHYPSGEMITMDQIIHITCVQSTGMMVMYTLISRRMIRHMMHLCTLWMLYVTYSID